MRKAVVVQLLKYMTGLHIWHLVFSIFFGHSYRMTGQNGKNLTVLPAGGPANRADMPTQPISLCAELPVASAVPPPSCVHPRRAVYRMAGMACKLRLKL